MHPVLFGVDCDNMRSCDGAHCCVYWRCEASRGGAKPLSQLTKQAGRAPHHHQHSRQSQQLPLSQRLFRNTAPRLSATNTGPATAAAAAAEDAMSSQVVFNVETEFDNERQPHSDSDRDDKATRQIEEDIETLSWLAGNTRINRRVISTADNLLEMHSDEKKTKTDNPRLSFRLKTPTITLIDAMGKKKK